MNIQENVNLQRYNTFGIKAFAKQFAVCSSATEIEMLDTNLLENIFVLGGGSNILFTKDVDGFVLQNNIKGIEVVRENEDTVLVKVGAGVNWHSFVLHCLENNWGGVENLALIPGNIGASPIQNIGAYGVEVKDVFESLTAYHLKEKKWIRLTNTDCAFGYRESIFKRELKNQCIITEVQFRLLKKHNLNTSYGAITQELEIMKVDNLSIKAVAQAVINIRNSKLPNPTEIGNAGSFFKNPTISKKAFLKIQVQHPSIANYPVDENNIKLAAGWLIEQVGFKGYRKGDAGCHAKQALVLVNYGQALGEEILSLSTEIIEAVKLKFGVTLEREVNIF
jgi:UDP-N-acetylmuramate dehydrogenase